jgi:putative ABC transport system substrate-binding protein
VLAAVGSPAVAAAKATTTTTPIVFYVGVDPVSFGFVSSLSRPGGNLTGVTNFSLEVGPKRLELLADLLGPQKVVGVLLNSSGAKVGDLSALEPNGPDCPNLAVILPAHSVPRRDER